MRQVLIVALLALLGQGCPKSAPPPPPGVTGDFDERQVCAADPDCAPLVLGCCDHCNGATAYGVHRDHLAEVTAEYTKSPPKCGTPCTRIGCAPLRGICRSERCGVIAGDVEQVTPLPRP